MLGGGEGEVGALWVRLRQALLASQCGAGKPMRCWPAIASQALSHKHSGAIVGHWVVRVQLALPP